MEPDGVGATWTDVSRRVDGEFDGDDRDRVRALLRRLDGLELEPPVVTRVRTGVLFLAEGDPDEVERYVEAAEDDYRDVLHWAFSLPIGDEEPEDG